MSSSNDWLLARSKTFRDFVKKNPTVSLFDIKETLNLTYSSKDDGSRRVLCEELTRVPLPESILDLVLGVIFLFLERGLPLSDHDFVEDVESDEAICITLAWPQFNFVICVWGENVGIIGVCSMRENPDRKVVSITFDFHEENDIFPFVTTLIEAPDRFARYNILEHKQIQLLATSKENEQIYALEKGQ